MLQASADFPITVAEVAASLQRDPILVEQTMGAGRSAQLHDRLTSYAHELPFEVYVALVSDPHDLPPSDQPGEDLAVSLHTRIGKPGLYVVETAKDRSITVKPFGLHLDDEVDLRASSNIQWLEETMRSRFDTDQVYLAPGVDALVALETAGSPLTPYHGLDYPMPQTLSPSQVDRLLDLQGELIDVGTTDDQTSARHRALLAASGVGTFVLISVPLLSRLLRRRPKRSTKAPRPDLVGPGLRTERLSADDITDVRAEAAAELVALADELSALPSPAPRPDAVPLALLAQQGAETLQRSGQGRAADAIGALVLARVGRREVQRAARRASSTYRPCFFSPLHGEAGGAAHWRFGEGDVSVPVCRACSRALASGTPVEALAMRGERPYFEGDDVWARTGFGSLADDLASQVMAARTSRGWQRRR